MNGETSLSQLLATLQPALQQGDYVFCSMASTDGIDLLKITGLFKQAAGITIIVEKDLADKWQLPYSYIAAWITLTVHSSLEAVGLTAAFSTVLAKETLAVMWLRHFTTTISLLIKKMRKRPCRSLPGWLMQKTIKTNRNYLSASGLFTGANPLQF